MLNMIGTFMFNVPISRGSGNIPVYLHSDPSKTLIVCDNHINTFGTYPIPINTIKRLSKLTLDQALHSPPSRPNLNNLQTHRRSKLAPLLLRTLLRCKVRHHDDVQTRRLPVSVRARDHVLVDQDLAVPGLHGLREV